MTLTVGKTLKVLLSVLGLQLLLMCSTNAFFAVVVVVVVVPMVKMV